jgi:hypothetical protein
VLTSETAAMQIPIDDYFNGGIIAEYYSVSMEQKLTT